MPAPRRGSRRNRRAGPSGSRVVAFRAVSGAVAQSAEERVGEHGEECPGAGDQGQGVGCLVGAHQRVDLQRQAHQQGCEEEQDGSHVRQRVQQHEPLAHRLLRVDADLLSDPGRVRSTAGRSLPSLCESSDIMFR